MSVTLDAVITVVLGTYNALTGGCVSPYELLRQRRGHEQREYDGKVHGGREQY